MGFKNFIRWDKVFNIYFKKSGKHGWSTAQQKLYSDSVIVYACASDARTFTTLSV